MDGDDWEVGEDIMAPGAVETGRASVIQSATDLYGADGAEVKAVTDALDAVGMTEDMQ